ncbi:NtaA/DmoA family FMN-dependent monooxygenase [Rhodococcus sp. T2V]|uniref:NtaA/DmoA family FMN-dependent monooxygenase n=1 Tax=Rhodococcus sp. T2V TaxID=3034164 RepID=UPI0023E0CD52|nr:NtaA/DmoA family FMN-dependent monooxygenase [Rhodococcus sp. T2V]MDF3305312.1 NtaA/DmoA family FMN-dependent monooxygenase [Rhodococcus sp. T2V]
MKNRKMLLCVQLVSGYGSEPGAWRLPGANPSAYTDMDEFVRLARAAERGKVQLLFLADTPTMSADLAKHNPQFPIDPLLVLTAIARGTERIGLVSTASTTFNEPYNLARQFKALDVISHGRAGWNAVTTSDPGAAANFGRTIPSRPERYGRAHEVVQIVHGLWGSWQRDAWVRDAPRGRFADMSKIRPVDLQGRYAAARGPLPIPPSEQGQPVVFQAGGGTEGLELAGMYADGVYANPFDIASARAQRNAIRNAAKKAGRKPDNVKVFVGFMPTIAESRRAALDRRRLMDESLDLRQRVRYLGSMIGVPLSFKQIDKPVPRHLRERAVANPHDPRSSRALEVIREGWTVRDVLAHGVIDYHPVVAGTATDVADHMQSWFDAGACDGFSLAVDAFHDGIDAFVDQVVPILQARGLFHVDYEGNTLRGHLGVPDRYGLDPRISRRVGGSRPPAGSRRSGRSRSRRTR